VTWYVIAVFVPEVAFAFAVYVTTPLTSVNVPSPVIATTPSGSHTAGDDPGVMRHVTDVFKPATELANPDAPVSVVNVAVPPGATLNVLGFTVGGLGKPTVTLINAAAR
jgi:hypothetical protein